MNLIDLFIGILLVRISVRTIKFNTNQFRPNRSNRMGMPSTSSAIIFFILGYFIFLDKSNLIANRFEMGITFGLAISICLLKWIKRHHSIPQIVLGSLYGFLTGYIINLIKPYDAIKSLCR